jgi:hypothetical protein
MLSTVDMIVNNCLRCIYKPRVEPILARVIPFHTMVAVAVRCGFCYWGSKATGYKHRCIANSYFLTFVCSLHAFSGGSIADGICNVLLLQFTSNLIGTARTPANSPINPAIASKNLQLFLNIFCLEHLLALWLLAHLSTMPPSTWTCIHVARSVENSNYV